VSPLPSGACTVRLKSARDDIIDSMVDGGAREAEGVVGRDIGLLGEEVVPWAADVEDAGEDMDCAGSLLGGGSRLGCRCC
jgi:hypothetical protein